MRKHHIYMSVLFMLVGLGLVMIYSASSVWAEYKTGNDKYYLYRQGIFAVVACIVFIFTSRIDYKNWLKWANKLFFVSIILLCLVLVPGIGLVRNGARSWIGFGDFSIQPAEFIKITYIIFLSKQLSKTPGSLSRSKKLFIYLGLTSVIFGLILLQPDFGTGVIFLLSVCLILFISLMKYRFVVIGVCTGGIAFICMILIAPYRLERIFSFLDPWSDPLGSGFQIIQSLYAISPASLFGYGLFRSRQKYFYLPEPQNDFIFAILCEEFGLIGGLIVIGLFFTLIYMGYRLALSTYDIFAMYLAFGFSTLLLVQVFINIAVVIGLIPVTGVTLPFISYGGSSLVITMFMMGIVVNIMKTAKKEPKYEINL